MGTTHVVSAGHHLAAAAGYGILEAGGNAVDAGVATGIMTNVVLPDNTGFGGVAPIMIYDAKSNITKSISGLGVWPLLASPEYFDNNCNGEIPSGILRSVVPGAPDAWLTALQLYGTMSFEEVVQPSLEAAKHGFPVSVSYVKAVDTHIEELKSWRHTAEQFLPAGKALQVGQKLVQTNLARTLEHLIETERANGSKGRNHGIKAARDEFYRGDIAREITRFAAELDGLLSMKDLRDFAVDVEVPPKGSYKDYDIATCGFWSQGPLMIQMLNMLERTNLRALGHNSSEYIHLFVEIMKLAFADREAYYGDPKFVDVPEDILLSKAYANERLKSVDRSLACPGMPNAGAIEKRDTNHSGSYTGSVSLDRDTSYLCVVDRWGNMFSATPSDPFGAPIIPELGFAISSRGSQSWLDRSHPSCLASGKRPRLTPNPAIVFREGRPWMAFGTPGGDVQPQAMVQVLLNLIEFGMEPQHAVEAPRFGTHSFPNSFWPHKYNPGLLKLEDRISDSVEQKLSKSGHVVERWNAWDEMAGGVCLAVYGKEKGTLIGAADPRRQCYAMGR
jgi:gamma-glutamyltranspeptidase/glutathione hydrolase